MYTHWIIIPENILTLSSIRIILIVAISGFCFNKRSKPKPAPEDNPATVEPKPIAPFKYIIVIATEIAQFGIRPTTAQIIG